MKNLFNNLKNCINESGELVASKEDIESSHRTAEKLCESLLGCTLNVRGEKFIIRMLEIYYGSVGDTAHDWYRNRFAYKKSKFIERTIIQAEIGFRVYINLPDAQDSYARMDLVVGNKNVAISFLLRSVWNKNFIRIGSDKGNPNIVLNAIGIKSSDHGEEIKMEENIRGISLEDTHESLYKERKLSTKTIKRIKVTSDFEDKNNLYWNFYAFEL